MVANISACGQIDSEALVDCLRGKSEEEILAINKVRLSGCVYGGKGLTGVGNTSLSFSGQVIPSPHIGVLTVLSGKLRPGHAKPAVGPPEGEGMGVLDELGRSDWGPEAIRKRDLTLWALSALQDHPWHGGWDLPAQAPPRAAGLCRLSTCPQHHWCQQR